MNNFADSLESYLIPAEEKFTDTKAGAYTMIALSLAALGVLTKDMLKMNKDIKERKRKEAENHKTWQSAPETKIAIEYVSRKYGINYYTPDDAAVNALYKKLSVEFEKDLIKISRKLNSNKKLCNEMVEKCRANLEEYDKDLFGDEEVKEIQSGICATNPEDYSWKQNEFAFEMLDASQIVIDKIGDYYYKSYTTAMNAKYEKEIQAHIISEFEVRGDGDEGIVGCDYLWKVKSGGNKK